MHRLDMLERNPQPWIGYNLLNHAKGASRPIYEANMNTKWDAIIVRGLPCVGL